MRNSTKMGGSIKKKYQAGGSTGYMKPTKKVMTKTGPDSYDKAIAKNKAAMDAIIKKEGVRKAVEKAKAPMPKKQRGGMIANARKKSLINRYNKASDRAKDADARYRNVEDYYANEYTNYDDNQVQGANPVTFTAGRKRQNAKINNAQARVGKNAEKERQIYKNVDTAERAYKNNKSDENSANWDAAVDAMARDYSGEDTNRTLNKIRGVESRVYNKVNNKLGKNEKRVEKIGKKLDKMGPKKTTAEMKAGGSLKPVNPGANPGLAKLPAPVRNKMGYMKKGGAHPGFKAVQAKIAAKSGVSKKAAGAILASSTRKASAKAKAANPRLKRVKG